MILTFLLVEADLKCSSRATPLALLVVVLAEDVKLDIS